MAVIYIWDNAFKNEPSKIFGKQPLNSTFFRFFTAKFLKAVFLKLSQKAVSYNVIKTAAMKTWSQELLKIQSITKIHKQIFQIFINGACNVVLQIIEFCYYYEKTK